jgi:hypothetical protein
MGRDTILESVQQQMDDQLQYIDVDNLIVRIPYGANAELKTFIARWLVRSFPLNKVVCLHRECGFVHVTEASLHPANVYYVKNN